MTLPKHEKAKRLLRPRVAYFQHVSAGSTALYRVYSADGDLLKMGICASHSINKRFIGWKRMVKWFPKDARMTLEHFPTHEAAQRALELALGNGEAPLREVYRYREKNQ